MGIRRHRPRVLCDLRPRKKSSFSLLPNRVNLRESYVIRIPLIDMLKIAAIFGIFYYLVFGLAFAPVSHNQLFAADDGEREALEKQLEDLEVQMAEYQGTIDKYKSQGKGLQGEIDKLNAKINKINLQIKSINLSLKKLDNEIVTNKERILTTEEKIEENKKILSRSLQAIYENENLNIVEILLRKPRLSDFFADVSDLFEIQEGMRMTLERVIGLREELFDEKEMLALKKLDAEQLYEYQDAQRESLSDTKYQKASLLEVTKGQEKKYQEKLEETRKTAAEIRSRIFKLLGGGELPFGEAVKIAELAEKSTGIRAAFILAILTQESAIKGVIGANLGGCYYNQEWSRNPEGRVMRSREARAFEDITKELKLDPNKMPVSCPIPRDGLYGGAMGPAQFMPTTWEIYKDKIGDITGNRPPNPWSNSDSFVATALYLKDAYNSSACVNYADEYSYVSPKQKLQERCAAAKYYAGSRWYTYRWRYGDPVAERADEFQEDINILNS